MMLRDFLATCATLALAGRFRDLHEFIEIVFKLLHQGDHDAVTVVLTPGPVTAQP